MSTLEGTTMHPRCRHICACWDLLELFHLFGTSQNISHNSISNIKRKQVKQNTGRNSIFFFLNLILILILTKLGWFQLFGTSQNSISNFFEKNSNFWVSMLYYSWRPFYWCINYQCRTNIDEAMVISALQHKSKVRISNFKKKIKFLDSHAVVLVKTFPLMYQLLM